MKDKKRAALARKWFIITFAAAEIFFLISFLRNLPGIITYDSWQQLKQVMGAESFNNHHPVANTLAIKLVFIITSIFTSDANKAVGTYIFLQMTCLALTFASCVDMLCRKGAPNKYLVLCVLFFALSPVNICFSVTMWKDMPFAAFVLLYSLVLWEVTDKARKGDKVRPSLLICAAVSALGFCLFRTNGFAAFAVLTVITSIMYFKRERIFVAVSLCVLILSGVIIGPIYSALGFEADDPIEALSIPAQQIAAVIVDGGDISADECDTLSEIVNITWVMRVYDPAISNPVKDAVRYKDNQQYIRDHKVELFKLWADIGIHNPGTYFKAYWNEIKGFFVPSGKRYIADSGVYENDLGIAASPHLPQALINLYDSYTSKLREGSVSALFSIGLTDLAGIAAFILCIIRRRKNYLILYATVLLILATLMISTPVSGEFRYMYSMFVSLPLFFYLPFCAKNDKKRSGVRVKKRKRRA